MKNTSFIGRNGFEAEPLLQQLGAGVAGGRMEAGFREVAWILDCEPTALCRMSADEIRAFLESAGFYVDQITERLQVDHKLDVDWQLGLVGVRPGLVRRSMEIVLRQWERGVCCP